MSSTAIDAHAPAAPNAQRLLWAGFMAILASGVGFALRGGILTQGQWSEEFGFTQTELGQITGGGLTGFGIVILLSSLIADRIGYGRLMISAFLMHLLSLVITLAAGFAYAKGGKPLAYQCLFWGTFLFAIGNGIAEAVVNPLVATLFPKNKTHYLNILHAGWPGGLIIGSLASFFMAGSGADAAAGLEKTAGVSWQIQISMILIPVVLYGLMMVGQKFPRSEASQSGVPYREMLRELGMAGALVVCLLLSLFVAQDLGQGLVIGLIAGGVLWLAFGASTGFKFGYIILAFLLIIHAMVGYVELGTDSWISKITGSILKSPTNGLMLLAYTSALMFALRFFAGPIVEKISPLGLLMASSLIAAVGLGFLGFAVGPLMCILAATIYGIGKTFFWPTMLAVVSEQFPKGGAITIGAAGGVGMLAAGLLGGPGIGFKQDHFASADLRARDVAVYDRYKADKPNQFLVFETVGLDGKKVGILEDGGKKIVEDLERLEKDPKTSPDSIAAQRALIDWWESVKVHAETDKPLVTDATLSGSRMALKLTALVPLTMLVCYTLLFLYYKARGGYRAKHVGPGEGTLDYHGMPSEVIEA